MSTRPGLLEHLPKFLETCSLSELCSILLVLHSELRARTLPGAVEVSNAYGALYRYRLAVREIRSGTAE
jgi:hypothetical protein